MIIDLNAADWRSKSVDIELAADSIELEAEHARLTGPVQLNCVVSRSGFQTSVAGKIGANFDIECCRCLQPVSVSLLLDFEVEFVDKEHFGVDGEHEIDPANLSADALESDQIDLNEVVREQLLLNLPERVYCREDCKGLCEICGANRNLKDCSCTDDAIDPRWSALKNLK
ncbi:MAG: hypothetical protein DMF62_14670 [Acidobacteria bacterium]|nr:MAG: hypothetical protein DMF62_14670 [Acidobacteriota bacterium]